jgi:hypothetical protein
MGEYDSKKECPKIYSETKERMKKNKKREISDIDKRLGRNNKNERTHE